MPQMLRSSFYQDLLPKKVPDDNTPSHRPDPLHAQLWRKAMRDTVKFLAHRADFVNFIFWALNFVEQAKFDVSLNLDKPCQRE